MADQHLYVSDVCDSVTCHAYTLLYSLGELPLIFSLQYLILVFANLEIRRRLDLFIHSRLVLYALVFSPCIFWGTMFVGKDGFISASSCISMLYIVRLNHNPPSIRNLWYLSLLVILAFTRPYFAIILILSICFASLLTYLMPGIKSILYNRSLKKSSLVVFPITGLLVFVCVYVGSSLGLDELFLKLAVDADYSLAYSNSAANVSLAPLPFPFLFLQVWRPFIWDPASIAYRSYALLFLVWSYLFVNQSFRLLSTPPKDSRVFLHSLSIPRQSFHVFFCLSIFFFSFNPNIGDIARKMSTISLVCLLSLAVEASAASMSKS